ncbi:MAG TPA: FecR domain-containing protein [Chitinophagaceae bacterium]|nr:FecR domain-containing protein [Chitinophagaceae bacterium]
MDTRGSRIEELFDLWNTDQATPGEREELYLLLRDFKLHDNLTSRLQQIWDEISPVQIFTDEETDAFADRILMASSRDLPVHKAKIIKVRFRKSSWYKYAGVLILIFFIGNYFLNKSDSTIHKPLANNSAPAKKEIIPGGNKAILKLADGSIIDLEKAKNGIIGNNSNSKVTKPENGQVVYEGAANSESKIGENTISTPRGGQYMVVLSDGTKVWLNASSSITFPVAFNGKERLVQLTGEGYFEVAKNPFVPFKVQIKEMEIAVLGTHFNVMAYDDENIVKTTLLEGSVKVSNEKALAILKPGQQASLKNRNGSFTVQQADVEEAVGWKNGFFIFNRSTLSSIMFQLSRWYDFDVRMTGDISNKKFSGTIARSTNISKVLEMLSLTKEVSFKTEGRTIAVTN